MTQLAFLVAVETYQDSTIPPAAHTETDAETLSRALAALGFARGTQVLLTGSQATRTALLSRLRKLRKTPPEADHFVVFVAGQMFVEQGEVYLACFDTQSDDLAETAVALTELLDALRVLPCHRLTILLDPRSDLSAGGIPHDCLADFATTRADAAILIACRPGEVSQVSGALKAGLWTHQIVQALTGKAPRALLEGHRLTAGSLQSYLEQELPRALRATFREAPTQTPVLLGAVDQVLADVTAVLQQLQPASSDPRLQPLRRGALRSETRGRVKALAGYRKFHRLPDRVSPSARSFVAELCSEDVKSDIDEVYAAVRDALGYKRRDVEGSADRNSGFVRTPDFEYSIHIELSDDDPTTVIWRREVSGIRQPDVVLSRPFQQVFGERFDTLVFEFTRAFDLEAWVDRIEEQVPERVKLRCASDCSWCDVIVAGFAGVIRLYRDRVEIQGRKMPGSKGLVEAFLHFQELFAGRRDLQELPLLDEA